MNLERSDVDDIMQILDSTQYDRLSVKTDRFSLRLQRTVDAGWQGELSTLAEANIMELDQSESAPSDSTSAVAAADAEGLTRVNAPLPGTFYRAPRPGAEPFVKEGDKVEPETVVCIVETMKLMNSVKAGCSGVIKKVLADNGQMVEQGAAMLLIDSEV